MCRPDFSLPAPKVSIIMPCYNEEKFIGRAIESLVTSGHAINKLMGCDSKESSRVNRIVGDGLKDSPELEELKNSQLNNGFSIDRLAGSGIKENRGVDDYFRENCELIVVDGGSGDRTREVVREYVDGAKAEELGIGGRVRLIDNPGRLQSHGLNAGIKEARGEIIVRADAHCVFPPGYVRRCVELLEATGAANVGGVMVPVADGPNANSGSGSGQEVIALALRHPAGVGDAKWHLGNYIGFVDTVYLGTFRRGVFEEVGFYDTNLKTNEDGELNLRILKAGKRIYLDSSIRVAYFPRETLGKLAKQYFHYGKGRCYTTLKHRKITSWRQAGPVALVAGLAAAFVLSLWRPAFLILPAAYVVSLPAVALLTRFKFGGELGELDVAAGFSLRSREREVGFSGNRRLRNVKIRLLTAAAWAIMHVSWGSGFWSHLIFRR